MRFGAEFVSILLLVLAGLIVFVKWYEASLLFYPEKDFLLDPSEFGLAPRDVTIATGSRGEKIHGWFFGSKGDKTIFYVHGNGGNNSDRLPVIKKYVENGFNLFIFDFRGFGKSDGRPTKKGIIEDTFAAYDYLVESLGIPPENIIILGQSLGGVPALRLANSRKCFGLILEGIFFSIREMARDIYSPNPLWRLASSSFNNGKEIKKLKVPVLLIHGRMDDVVPVRHSRMLYEVSPEPKELIIFETAAHVDMYEADPRLYFESLLSFSERKN